MASNHKTKRLEWYFLTLKYTDKDIVALLRQYAIEKVEAIHKFPNRIMDINHVYAQKSWRLLRDYRKL